jgi:hypothetical protein
MAGIVFWFQEKDRDVFSSRRIDLDAWRYAAKAGGIDKARCINQTDQHLHFDGDFDFEIIGQNSSDLRKWLEDQENAVIFQCEWSCSSDAIPMRMVDHTNVDWYVFGEGNSTPPDLKGQYVYMPQCDQGGLHPVHAASAAMLRRWEELLEVNK